MNDSLISEVVESIAAAGFRKAPQGWRQHGQHVHPLDVQDMAVFGLKARQAAATVKAVEAVKRELARNWPESVPPGLAPAPTSSTLSAEAAVWVWRFSMYTLNREASGWHLDGRPILFAQVRKMCSGWALAVAEAHGLGADLAPDPRKVMADLRKLIRDAAPR